MLFLDVICSPSRDEDAQSVRSGDVADGTSSCGGLKEGNLITIVKNTLIDNSGWILLDTSDITNYSAYYSVVTQLNC